MTDPNRIKKAWKRGYSSGRYWRLYHTKLWPEYSKMSPYSTFWPGVQCHVAWKVGFRMAFNVSVENLNLSYLGVGRERYERVGCSP